jgi:hypothetical protein
MSIPFVSASVKSSPYHPCMAEKQKKGGKAPAWAIKMRAHLRETKQSMGAVASKMRRAESTIRSWLNGNRGSSVDEFIHLIDVTKADIHEITGLTPDAGAHETLKKIREMAEGALGGDRPPPKVAAKVEGITPKARKISVEQET